MVESHREEKSESSLKSKMPIICLVSVLNNVEVKIRPCSSLYGVDSVAGELRPVYKK